jgi:hypothetical protein
MSRKNVLVKNLFNRITGKITGFILLGPLAEFRKNQAGDMGLDSNSFFIRGVMVFLLEGCAGE